MNVVAEVRAGSSAPHGAEGPALELHDVGKSFGGIRALEGLSLDVRRGEVHGLIGPNGAGKTTAINLATGVYAPDRGAVRILGREVTGLKPYTRAALGFARTFQNARPFGNLDVYTNVALAVERRLACEGKHAERRAVRSEVEAVLDASGLGSCAYDLARLQPYGRQKILEIVRALAFARNVILLDEPAAGLSLSEIDQMLALVLVQKSRLAILIVEHNMDVVMPNCDRVTVLDAGRFLASGTPNEIQRHPEVVRAYLGA